MAGANLTDPAVLGAFRQRMGEFLSDSHTALGGVVSQFHAVEDLLQGELLTHWKGQLRRREEAYTDARLRYLAARAEVDQNSRGRGGGKQSCDEERMEMQKTQRRRDEAEERIKAIQQWLHRLRQDASPIMIQCRNHDLAISELGAQAMQALERMAVSVEAYHDVRVPTSTQPPGALP